MPLPVKFGASTWLWTSPFTTQSIETIFPKIAAMGFDVVEIAIEDPALIDGQAVSDALKRHKLEAVVCGAFGPTRDLTHSDPEIHKNCFRYIKACLDFCVQWNTPFFAGPMYSAVGKARMVPPEQRKAEWALAVKNLALVAQMAADRNLEIAIEPLNRFESDLVNTCEDGLQMIEDIGHPAVKIMLDGFHMNIEERDAEKAIIRAGEKLLHFQVSENYRGTPGSGQTQWEAYKNGLDAVGYQGCVSIESFTPDNKELAAAVCFWKPMADDQDSFATEGLQFLKGWANQSI